MTRLHINIKTQTCPNEACAKVRAAFEDPDKRSEYRWEYKGEIETTLNVNEAEIPVAALIHISLEPPRLCEYKIPFYKGCIVLVL